MTALVGPGATAAPRSRRGRSRLVGGALLLYVVAWGTWVLLPVRWFVTYVHELGHALMTELVGGDTQTLTINSSAGGLTRSRVPASDLRALLVSSAGYVGIALFGAALLGFSGRARSAKAAFIVLALVCGAAAVFWVPWNLDVEESPMVAASGTGTEDGHFTWIFVLALVAALIGLAFLAPVRVRQGFAVVLAVMCCVSALGDVRNLIGFTTGRVSHSDATLAEEISGLDAWVWAWLWAAMALVAILVGLRVLTKTD
jgi:hypothetical protein